MDQQLSIRLFDPVASSPGEHRATVWVQGGAPPFWFEPQKTPGVEVDAVGTGRVWCLTIRGGSGAAIQLNARDYSGSVVHTVLHIGEEATPASGADPT